MKTIAKLILGAALLTSLATGCKKKDKEANAQSGGGAPATAKVSTAETCEKAYRNVERLQMDGLDPGMKMQLEPGLEARVADSVKNCLENDTPARVACLETAATLTAMQDCILQHRKE